MRVLLLALLAAPLCAPLLPIPGQGEGGRGLVPVQPDPDSFDPGAWETRLSETDLELREQRFDEIVRLARRDPEARAFLEERAGVTGQGELAWTARLALRELGRPRIPRDALGRLFGDLRSRFTLDPFALPLQGATPPGVSRSIQIQGGEGGWVIQVTENDHGEERVHEHRGKTLEEILDAHPRLRQEIEIGGSIRGPGLRLRIHSPSGAPFDFDELLDQFGPRGMPTRPRTGGATPAHKLGVVVRADPAGEGLRVRGVYPGTIAHLLGIGEGDVLLELNGTDLTRGEDVTRVMGRWAEVGEVAAVWVDSEGTKRSGVWRPKD